MNKLDDLSQLKNSIANDDQLAYRQLFIQFYSRLFRFVMSFIKNKELAEEIVSDVFINVWRRRTNLEDISNLRLYLYVSAKNITFNYLKKLDREKKVDLDTIDIEPESPFADPYQVMITSEMNQRIKSAIDQLPPRCKLIYILVREDGLSYGQAAKLLQLSVSTIDNQLTIAIKKIAGTIHYSFKRQ